ncbi:hypothetical protein [Streptomyces sp. NPDC000983]|uniref:hypothetical protein n=1 Tax=Streptomyces sp. NPDC000983 TaxID=3154373 RepID=UPI003329D8C0
MAVTVVVLAATVILLLALLAAVGAGTLARMDAATWPATLTRSATAFAAVITLAAAVTAALSAFLT